MLVGGGSGKDRQYLPAVAAAVLQKDRIGLSGNRESFLLQPLHLGLKTKLWKKISFVVSELLQSRGRIMISFGVALFKGTRKFLSTLIGLHFDAKKHVLDPRRPVIGTRQPLHGPGRDQP